MAANKVPIFGMAEEEMEDRVELFNKEKTPHDFYNLDNHIHQFKGSSASIGAKKVKAECQQFREYCRAGNGEGPCRDSSYNNFTGKAQAHFLLNVIEGVFCEYLVL
ncbi:hypothetical protein ABKV19_000619 [Rosa sericea]